MRNLLLFILFLLSGITLANTGYFRYPDLHNDTLVFTAEGDLWLADIKTGQSQRLTTQVAEETQASISQDGKQIAYVANYEGVKEVYVIPLKGGIAKRVSFENAQVRVHGWTQSGEVIYTTTGRVGSPGNWEIATVHPQSLKNKTIPLADAIEASFDETDATVYFTRFGLLLSADNSKVYRGGAMGKLWKYNLGTDKEAQQLVPEHEGSIRKPMSYKDNVYFISDASGADNIWSVSKTTGQTQQLTTYTDWPVRTANMAQ